MLCLVSESLPVLGMDCHRFDADPDPDPTFHFDADPDPDPTSSYTQV
jgi:hypothetical protein